MLRRHFEKRGLQVSKLAHFLCIVFVFVSVRNFSEGFSAGTELPRINFPGVGIFYVEETLLW